MGGEEMTFKLGEKRPVFVQVWSSHARNLLTQDRDVRYLNVEVQNLPNNSGGIIGLDKYLKPSTSRCGLVQGERDLAEYINKEFSLVGLMRLSRPQWIASATVEQ
eukprot:TRINITY_DN94572_c0_g1_i1.p1 TRINITY_DN94572_c0_g1~~TRINITY_DN94572_c0_g1_i1.p1  ORF type:complete len:115 (+),score=25.54 TRINITY_DN94572_c0_g1_i1:33-347(+)